jgi:hypothetical protein
MRYAGYPKARAFVEGLARNGDALEKMMAESLVAGSSPTDYPLQHNYQQANRRKGRDQPYRQPAA